MRSRRIKRRAGATIVRARKKVRRKARSGCSGEGRNQEIIDFYRQKAAYEMVRSLVGSEVC